MKISDFGLRIYRTRNDPVGSRQLAVGNEPNNAILLSASVLPCFHFFFCLFSFVLNIANCFFVFCIFYFVLFCIGNVAAHVTKKQFEKFIKQLKNKLVDGGFWIFQVKNWDYILKQKTYQFPQIHIPKSELSFYREYSQISSKKITFETLLKSGEKIIFKDSVSLYPVTSDDYLGIHKDSGYELAGIYCDYTKSPYTKFKDQAGIYVFTLKF